MFFLAISRANGAQARPGPAAPTPRDSHVSPTGAGTVQPASRQTLAPRQQVTADPETLTRHPGSIFRQMVTLYDFPDVDSEV